MDTKQVQDAFQAQFKSVIQIMTVLERDGGTDLVFKFEKSDPFTGLCVQTVHYKDKHGKAMLLIFKKED